MLRLLAVLALVAPSALGDPCGRGFCEEKCCGGGCAPADATCCGNGWCAGACGSDGKCCPDQLPLFDATSGYCCAGTACDCANDCGDGCCPGGTVCCDGGWCAPHASDCPRCPASHPNFCPDGTCAPVGGVCCGGAHYCPTGLPCVDVGDGQFACGDGSIQPVITAYPTNNSGSVPPASSRASQRPGGMPNAGTAPSPATVAGRNPTLFPGCHCQVGSGGGPPWLLLAGLFLWRRLRRPSPPASR